MALHALAQCTVRLLLTRQQQQGCQLPDGGDEEWRMDSTHADLGMEERARGSWWVCVLHACIHPFMIPCIRLFMHACVRSHSFVQQAAWHGAGLCYLACRTQCFCAGIRDAARCDCLVQKTRKSLKRPLTEEVADASFMYSDFLHGLGHIYPSA